MTSFQSARKKTALITGASGGIGLELARIFAGEGYDLVLVARNRQALQALTEELKTHHGTSAAVIAKDLGDPNTPQEIFDQLQKENVSVDTLINNAGFATHWPFAEGDLKTELNMIQVNVAALTALTRLFAGIMKDRRRGEILNVASTAAFQPGPFMAIYYATKAYVLSFSEALAEELKDSGVTVTCLCPGATATGFQKRASIEGILLLRRKIMDARTVAWAGYRGLKRKKRVVIPGWLNKAGAFSVRLSPRDWVTSVVRLLQEKNR